MSQPRPEPDLLQAVCFWLSLCGFACLVAQGRIGILGSVAGGLACAWIVCGPTANLSPRAFYRQLIERAPALRPVLLALWPLIFFLVAYGGSLAAQQALILAITGGSITSWENLPQTSWLLDHVTNKLIYGIFLMATAVQWRTWLIVDSRPQVEAVAHKCDHC